MKKYQLALLATLAAGACFAKPDVHTTPGLKGGVSRTVIDTWQLSDTEKKNYAPQMMSQISAKAIAPTMRIKLKEWTSLVSEHQACFYNTFGVQVAGRYIVKFNVAGQEVNAFDSVVVNPGQALCVTRYLQMWAKGVVAGDFPAVADTHVEMDGQVTDNQGRGTITVR